MSRNWITINSKIIYSNQWITLNEDSVYGPNGKKGIYAYLEKNQGVVIIAQDKDHSIYFINEYRYPIKRNIIQLPAGNIDNKNELLKQAPKELYEETGITAKHFNRIGGFYVAPGHETTYVNVFLATELNITRIQTEKQEDNEAIQEIVNLSIADIKKLIVSDKIECGITLSALNLFLLKYD